MSFLDKILNFQHFDLIAIPLTVFVFWGSGVFGQLIKQTKQEFETRKLYPELIQIYKKYFYTNGVPRGLNVLGTVLANEPVFVGTTFIFYTKLTWPQSLLRFTIAISGLSFAGIGIYLFFIFKDFSYFHVSLFLIILGVILATLIFQSFLRNIILKRLTDFHKEVDSFLQTKQLTYNDIYLPINYDFGSCSYLKILSYNFYIGLAFTTTFILFFYLPITN